MASSMVAESSGPVSGLVHEDKEVVLKIRSLWGQGGGLEVFSSLFPRIFAKLGIPNGDEGGHEFPEKILHYFTIALTVKSKLRNSLQTKHHLASVISTLSS